LAGALSIIARIERRNASARPIEGSTAVVLTRPVVSFTVASESTGQCETRIERAPPQKKALARPDRPSAPAIGVAETDEGIGSLPRFGIAAQGDERRGGRKHSQGLPANESIGRAEALRRSMLAMIDGAPANSNEAHPALWAPFILAGEGGAKR
jgi:hypothetical protein